jgi:predicted phosphate transport protein (TIGR00153 family)
MAGINSIFAIFTPKNKIFYDYFEEMVDKLLDMSGKFQKMVHSHSFEEREKILQELENGEHSCDDTTHTLFTELGRNFITPFDREDIHYLASALDDIADYIYSSGKKINFYRLDPIDDGVHKLAALIHEGTIAIRDAVYELRNLKDIRKITQALIKVNAIENEADDLFDINIDKLFEIENDFKMLIKRRELYQAMETATDKIEDAGNVIESIIIKYA